MYLQETTFNLSMSALLGVTDHYYQSSKDKGASYGDCFKVGKV